MEKYRKKTCIEVVERTPCGGYLVQNEGNPADRWVIDKDTFESTYLPADQLQTIEEMGGTTAEQMKEQGAQFGFDIAVSMLKDGHKLARAGWNGKDMYVRMEKAGDFDFSELLPFLVIKNVKNSFNTWVPSIF